MQSLPASRCGRGPRAPLLLSLQRSAAPRPGGRRVAAGAAAGASPGSGKSLQYSASGTVSHGQTGVPATTALVPTDETTALTKPGDADPGSLRRALRSLYGFLAAASAAQAALKLALPRFYFEHLFTVTAGEGSVLLTRLVGASIITLAASFVALESAANKDHLKSDTYKRLNLGVIVYCAVALAGLATTPGQLTNGFGKALLLMTSVFSFAAAGAGLWEGFAGTPRQSPLGVAKAVGEGCLQTLAGTFRWYSGSMLALALRALSIAIAWGVGTQLTQQVRELGAAGWVAQYPEHLLMAASFAYWVYALFVLHTQQDAAERRRLGASSFKALSLGFFASATLQTTLQVQGLLRGLMTHTAYWTIFATAAIAVLSGAAYVEYDK